MDTDRSTQTENDGESIVVEGIDSSLVKRLADGPSGSWSEEDVCIGAIEKTIDHWLFKENKVAFKSYFSSFNSF